VAPSTSGLGPAPRPGAGAVAVSPSRCRPSDRRGWLDALHRPEHDLAALGVDDDRLAHAELLPEDPLRQRVLHELLDRAPERSGSEGLVVALLRQQLLRRPRELEPEALALELLAHPLHHEIDDLGDLVERQLVEHDHLVDAVQELGAEVPLQGFVDLLLHALVRDRLARLGEPDRGLAEVRRAEVRGHDEHGVLEVHRSALSVGEPAVLEDLEQRVEHVGVRLFDLVEQHDRERLASHGLGELAALLVAHVTGRRPDQTAHRVLLHVLAHVELDERPLVPEEELRERLGELGLPDAGGPEEDERPARPLGVLEACPRPADRSGQRLDGVVLPDHAVVQLLLHPEQLGRLLLGELVDGDPRPVGKDLRDHLLVDDVEALALLGAPLGLHRLLALELLLLERREALGLVEGLPLDRSLLVAPDLGELLLELAQVRGRCHAADPQAAARLVDQVDGLVRQVPVRDVAVGEVRRGHEGLVGDRDRVVALVAVAQALQDVDRVGQRRFLDLDRLEPALERGVLFQVLAVLVEGRRADRLQLASREHRLEDRRRVDRALGGTRPDEGVQLVDEQDDVAAGPDLLEDLLEALLEVTPVAAPRHERAEVERVELLALQGLGDVVAHDALGEPLHDGGLAHPRLADEHRVVLRAPGQHLHHALDLPVPADHRVELVLPGERGQVAAELVEHRRTARCLLPRGARGAGRGVLALVAREELDHLLAHARQVRPQAHEHLGRHALALPDQAEEHVLGPDVVVAELERLAKGQLEDLLGARRERRRARRRGPGRPDRLLHLLAHRLERDPERLERLGGDALALVDQPEQDVLGADEVVVEQAGLLLGEDEDSACPVSEPLEQVSASWDGSVADRSLPARRVLSASIRRARPRRVQPHPRAPLPPQVLAQVLPRRSDLLVPPLSRPFVFGTKPPRL
jgi:hypothetical protein